MFLQQYMNKLLGPLLILVGLLILDIVPLRLPAWGGANSAFIHRLSDGGTIGAIFLGFIFALSFCPVSAALFFGSVIPLALKFESGIWLPLCYGIGTALPVIGFAPMEMACVRETGPSGKLFEGAAVKCAAEMPAGA